MGYMYLFQFWFPQGIGLRVGFLGHMVVLFLVFKGIPILSSIVTVSIYIPPRVQEYSLFSTPFPAFILRRLFDEGHSDWCEVISHCGFDLHFSSNEKEKAMAPHSSTLAWKIPWTEEPGRLQSMGSLRVRHD